MPARPVAVVRNRRRLTCSIEDLLVGAMRNRIAANGGSLGAGASGVKNPARHPSADPSRCYDAWHERAAGRRAPMALAAAPLVRVRAVFLRHPPPRESR